MTGNTGHVMNLANSVIGVSLLAMPFCFKQCGITLAIAMLVLSSVLSRLACNFLVKSSTLCRRRNFEFLAFYTFGPSGKLLVELGVIGFLIGTCVAFFVVMGDIGPDIISKILNINNNGALRTTVLVGLGVLVVLPLGLLKNVESLAAVSTITIGFYFLFTLKIFIDSSPQLLAGDWWYHVNFWQPEGVLQCIPIFAMSLSCQTQLFEIYESISAPTIEKINFIVYSAINLCTIVYGCVGLLGYIAYCKGSFTGNILLSFTPTLSSEMFKLGFVMSIALSFPLVIFPCRASLYSLIFRRMSIHHELTQLSSHIPDSRFKWLTIAIVTFSLITGLFIPSIELVLGLVGSTIGIAICVIFPSLSFLNLNNRNTNDQVIAKVTVVIGIVIMVMGTFGNLFAAIEYKSNELPFTKLGNMNDRLLPDVDVLQKKEINMELSKKNIPLIKPIFSNKLTDGAEMEENQRKEPPVPVDPIKSNKKNVFEQLSHKVNERRPESLKVDKKSEFKSIKLMKNSGIKHLQNLSVGTVEKGVMKRKQTKIDRDPNERESLKILNEHENENNKLLEERSKILFEIKYTESNKKYNKSLKEKSISHAEDNDLKSFIHEAGNDNTSQNQSFTLVNGYQSASGRVRNLKPVAIEDILLYSKNSTNVVNDPAIALLVNAAIVEPKDSKEARVVKNQLSEPHGKNEVRANFDWKKIDRSLMRDKRNAEDSALAGARERPAAVARKNCLQTGNAILNSKLVDENNQNLYSDSVVLVNQNVANIMSNKKHATLES